MKVKDKKAKMGRILCISGGFVFMLSVFLSAFWNTYGEAEEISTAIGTLPVGLGLVFYIGMIIGLSATVIGLFIMFNAEYVEVTTDAPQPTVEISDRIAKVQESLGHNLETLIGLQDEIKAQVEFANRLSEQIKENKDLLSITEEQRNAIYKEIRQERKSGDRKTLALNLALGLVFMLGGVVLGRFLPKLF